jgi:hypothetical protein
MNKLCIVPEFNIVFVQDGVFEYNDYEYIAAWRLDREGYFYRTLYTVDALESCEISDI